MAVFSYMDVENSCTDSSKCLLTTTIFIPSYVTSKVWTRKKTVAVCVPKGHYTSAKYIEPLSRPLTVSCDETLAFIIGLSCMALES